MEQILDEAVLTRVQRLVQRFRQMPEAELEVRIGTAVDNTFEAGVTAEEFARVCHLLDGSTHMKGGNEPFELHDFHYLAANTPLRTRISYDAYELRTRTETVRKRTIAKELLRVDDAVLLRVALSTETPAEAPASVPRTTLVRIQQRQTFLWDRRCTMGVSSPNTSPAWRYDLSRTWHGANRTEAEEARANAAPHSHEIEIEVKHDYVKHHDNRFVAASLLLKALDLIQGEKKCVVLWRP